MVNFAILCTIVYSTMKGSIKEIYEAPAVEVVDMRMDSVILQMSQQDYNYGGLDEDD